jgi:RimJ/RimL family protein N-acetyltransferase
MQQLIHLIRPDNQASIRVAQKLGAALTGSDFDGGPVVIYAKHRPTEV